MTVKGIVKHPILGLKKYLSLAGELGYNGFRKFWVACDIFWWRKRYHCFPDEYQLFRFDRIKSSYRKEYLLRFDQYVTYAKINFPTMKISNKANQYKLFGDLIGREWMVVDPAKLDEVRAFAEKHGKVLFKPSRGSCGVGIFAYEPAVDSEEVLATLLEKCVQKLYLCEEYVVQHPVMAAFHPHSVNTVRVFTFNNGKEIKILGATLKLGISDCVVDNIRHEGLGANIDVETGIVNTPGYDFERKAYYFHPETGAKIIGTQIPHFDKVLDVVRKGAALVPECAVIGWDIAVTQDGVNIIEMNNRPGVRIIQMYDMMPRGKEIKEFVRNNKAHLRKIPPEEQEHIKRRY